jgi:hypothetical protein
LKAAFASRAERFPNKKAPVTSSPGLFFALSDAAG